MKYDLGEPLNFEVHHIIPINVLEKNKALQDLFLWAEQNGKKFDFNGLDNGIPLQKKRLKYGVNGHAKHPNYDEAVIGKIEDVLKDKSLNNLNKYDEIQEIINNIKIKLEQDVLLGNKDVNDIINF
ncbi:AHH domain-containing protein [Capnocytophaga canimorsus]|uniref:AHH domain-containing protein n=1 Tax=Capnocytophaga canimorsus TaxID=28188 RepID=UPI00385DC372